MALPICPLLSLKIPLFDPFSATCDINIFHSPNIPNDIPNDIPLAHSAFQTDTGQREEEKNFGFDGLESTL